MWQFEFKLKALMTENEYIYAISVSQGQLIHSLQQYFVQSNVRMIFMFSSFLRGSKGGAVKGVTQNAELNLGDMFFNLHPYVCVSCSFSTLESFSDE